MAMNIKMFAIEYEIEWAMPRISFGNSSAVMVHGIVSNPIMEKQTYSNKHRTGTQSCCEVPVERRKKICKIERDRESEKKKLCVSALTKDFWNIFVKCVQVPSLIHLVNVPETNITIAIPMPDVITSGRRLNRFKIHAFDNDMKNRVTPTKIDTWYGFTLLPIS